MEKHTKVRYILYNLCEIYLSKNRCPLSAAPRSSCGWYIDRRPGVTRGSRWPWGDISWPMPCPQGRSTAKENWLPNCTLAVERRSLALLYGKSIFAVLAMRLIVRDRAMILYVFLLLSYQHTKSNMFSVQPRHSLESGSDGVFSQPERPLFRRCTRSSRSTY